MGLNLGFPEGATPIDPEEAQDLIPSLSTQAELNEFELLNIMEAAAWAERSRKVRIDLLNPQTLRLLHKRMFGKTWRWAGIYRKTQKSIGVEAYRIAPELHGLTEDVKAWLQFESYAPAEIAARFHHRLVLIHAFQNGNGRHARMATDLLCVRQGWPASGWGSSDLVAQGTARAHYLDALRQADQHNLGPLIEFMAMFPSWSRG